uniref:F-box domain-containing protein n=1 Tax=Parastrongyloides trichosuri TaxID=131310 RepID=A0A0N4ZNH9_PARTI
MPIEEISHITEDVLSYMCTLAVQKCSKKSEKKKAACGGEAMRKRLLIKNFVAFLLKQETILKQNKEKLLSNNNENESEEYDFDDEGCTDEYVENEHVGMYGNDSSDQSPHPGIDDEETNDDTYDDEDKRLLSDEEMPVGNCSEIHDPMLSYGGYMDGSSVISDSWNDDVNKIVGNKYPFILTGDENHDHFSSAYSGIIHSYGDRNLTNGDSSSDCLFDDLSTSDNLGSKNIVFGDDSTYYKKDIKDEYSLNNLENMTYSSCMSPLRTSNYRSEGNRQEGSFRRLYTDLDTMNTVVEEGSYVLNDRIDENSNISSSNDNLHDDFSNGNTINSNYSILTEFDSEYSSSNSQNRKRSMSGRFYADDDYSATNSLNYMMLSSPKRLKL